MTNTLNPNEIKMDEKTRIKCSVLHKNSCGEPIRDKDGKIQICCGDDLGGDNNEFAQCGECRTLDYIDEIIKLRNCLKELK